MGVNLRLVERQIMGYVWGRFGKGLILMEGRR